MSVAMLGTSLPASYVLDLRAYDPRKAAARLALPMLVLQGERDYQVGAADFAGWKQALDRRRDATLKLYPLLNHLFMAGEGPPGPGDYEKPGHVDAAVIADIAAWIEGLRPSQPVTAPSPKAP